MSWFEDRAFVRGLPLRLRLYAAWGRMLGAEAAHHVRGAGFLRRSLLRASRVVRAGTLIVVRERGVSFRVDLADGRLDAVLDEIRRLGRDDLLAEYLHDGDSFIDIGANHGTFALRAAQLVGPTGSVLAVEPQRSLAELIRDAATANGFHWCRVRQCAVGTHQGRATLYVPAGGSGTAGLHGRFSAVGRHETDTVDIRSLDDLTQEQRLPGRLLIKLDVEGSELGVLRSARRTVETFRPAILYEVNQSALAAAGESPDALAALLVELGFAESAPPDDLTARRPTREAIAAGAPDLVALLP